MSDTSYYIICPPQVMTGGPEALHQLASKLIKLGKSVYMVYFHGSSEELNFSNTVHHDRVVIAPQYSSPVHDAYKHYNVPHTCCIVDNAKSRVIIPEIWPHLIDNFLGAKVYYWWLSYDYGIQAINRIGGLKSIGRSYTNLVQSQYAKKMVERLGISQSYDLSDFTSPSNFSNDIALTDKRDLILYNRKGQYEAETLKPYLKDFNFELIANMTPEQVRNKMAQAKVYIDFGPHPGMDRMPREAAASFCCVVTGLKGSASYFEDVSIPAMYKIDTDGEFLQYATALLQDIVKNFEKHSPNFEYYRSKIFKESGAFEIQVNKIFGE